MQTGSFGGAQQVKRLTGDMFLFLQLVTRSAVHNYTITRMQ